MTESAAQRLAISNIAWTESEDDAVIALLTSQGIRGLEIAPSRVHPEPVTCPAHVLDQYRALYESRGIRIVAMQSLLYGRADLTIFESRSARTRTADYLTRVLDFGQRLGASVAVFGSPLNRHVGNLDRDRANQVALDFFRGVGREAQARSMWFCIEPNPAVYGCDFLTTSLEAAAFLREAATPGLGLHLDAAAMTLSGERAEDAIPDAAPLLRHFHASEPQLKMIGSGGVDHGSFARALAAAGYKGWISIEMRPAENNLGNVVAALDFAQSAYAAVL